MCLTTTNIDSSYCVKPTAMASSSLNLMLPESKMHFPFIWLNLLGPVIAWYYKPSVHLYASDSCRKVLEGLQPNTASWHLLCSWTSIKQLCRISVRSHLLQCTVCQVVRPTRSNMVTKVMWNNTMAMYHCSKLKRFLPLQFIINHACILLD
jgi:hypothetical protein